jgi:hypothetical protein
MKKNLLLLLTISFFVSCSSLDDGIDEFQNDIDQINAPTYLDPTELWGEDSTGGGGSGTSTNYIVGNCDVGSFEYFLEPEGDRFKIKGNYYKDGSIMKIENLDSEKLTSNSSSGQFGVATITLLQNSFNTTTNRFTITVFYSVYTSGYDKYGVYNSTTYHSRNFTVDPCNQIIN